MTVRRIELTRSIAIYFNQFLHDDHTQVLLPVSADVSMEPQNGVAVTCNHRSDKGTSAQETKNDRQKGALREVAANLAGTGAGSSGAGAAVQKKEAQVLLHGLDKSHRSVMPKQRVANMGWEPPVQLYLGGSAPGAHHGRDTAEIDAGSALGAHGGAERLQDGQPLSIEKTFQPTHCRVTLAVEARLW